MIKVGTMVSPYHDYNDDDFDWGRTVDGVEYGIVADGAGGLEYGWLGASITVFMMTNVLQNGLNKEMSLADVEDLIKSGISETQEFLKGFDNYREFGCTVSLGVRGEFGSVVYILGDAFGVVREGESLRFVQPIQDREYSNLTTFITSPKYDETIYKTEADTTIALSSDGLERAGINLQNRVPVAGFWSWVLDGTITPTNMIQLVKDKGKLDDDATLVVLGVKK